VSKREDEAYRAWLEEVKSKNPDVAPVLDQFAETEAGREIFRGGLREADYYRRLNEFHAEKEKLTAAEQQFQKDVELQSKWWEEAKPTYDRTVQEAAELRQRLEAVKKEYGVDPNDLVSKPVSPSPQPDNTIVKELKALEARVQAMDRNFPGVTLGLLQAQQAAFQEGLTFDPQAVFQRVYQNGVDPLTAFNQLAAPQREEKVKKVLEGELERAREEGRKEALSKLSGPDRMIGAARPSIVETLRSSEAPIANRNDRVDAAVKDFIELTNSGQS
jgi:DNA repair exonuclease SbcCD ATPase subunit